MNKGKPKLSWLRRFWKPLFLLLVIAIVMLWARSLRLEDLLVPARQRVEDMGAWSLPAFIVVYILGVLLAVPGILLTAFAGILFGPFRGTVAASAGSTIGAGLAFLIARYFARSSVADWVEGNARFQRLDDASERYGAMLVAVIRFVPVLPFNLVNYGFGLTRVRFGTYLFWSWLAMFPWTIVYVVAASTGSDVAAGLPVHRGWLAVGGAVLAGSLILGHFARRKWQRIDSVVEKETTPP